MSSQFAELQTLFDEVSHQLYTECKRIEGAQETVNACVKKSKEVEAIHHKLEESHQMLTHERGERIRTEHSKEKLQSLTSQMLLARLNLANTQALALGVDKLLNANMR